MLTLGLAFLVGCICGLRSMTAPAVVAWGVWLGWLHLQGSSLAFLGKPFVVGVLTVLAIGELIADKFPFIPNRTSFGPLVTRIVLGAICGAALAVSGGSHASLGAVLGGFGGIAGAFLGFNVRRKLSRTESVPKRSPHNLIVALGEDLVAVVGGLLIVSRF